MSLTDYQKSNLWGLFAVSMILALFAGLGYLVYWCCETSAVTHFCSGATGITVSQDNAGDQSTSVKFNDPKCK